MVVSSISLSVTQLGIYQLCLSGVKLCNVVYCDRVIIEQAVSPTLDILHWSDIGPTLDIITQQLTTN